MPKRSSKKKSEDAPPAVPAQAAEKASVPVEADEKTAAGKNPAAVALGRLGGKKGGPARAKKLTKEQRSGIAKKAAAVRWAKKKQHGQP